MNIQTNPNIILCTNVPPLATFYLPLATIDTMGFIYKVNLRRGPNDSNDVRVIHSQSQSSRCIYAYWRAPRLGLSGHGKGDYTILSSDRGKIDI